MDNLSCGSFVQWRIYCLGGGPVENLSCGSFIQLRICRVGVSSNGEFAVGGLSSREFIVWEFCPVENLSCGGVVQ